MILQRFLPALCTTTLLFALMATHAHARAAQTAHEALQPKPTERALPPAPNTQVAATPPAAQVPGGGIETVNAAVNAARQDARRTYSSASAQAAAWMRLERTRAPLLDSEDPRAATWLADAAEDDITLGLAVDNAGVTTIAGLATSAQKDRATAVLRSALTRTRAAERAARSAIAAGTATPAMANHLDAVELAKRIPLIRACAAVLAAWCGALPPEDSQAIVESASMRLANMRLSLNGNARALADTCCGLGLVRIGRRVEADAILAPLAAATGTDNGLRMLAIAGLAENAASTATGKRRALDALRERLGTLLDDDARLLLGDLDFRLARAATTDATTDSSAQAPAWRGWIDAIEATPRPRRPAMRAAALQRIAQHCEGMDDPVIRVARALSAVTVPATRADGASALRILLADSTLEPGVATLAMLELGRAELLLGHPAAGALALLAYAESHPAEPASRHAIDAAVAAARGTGDAQLLSRVLATAVGRFPDHPDHAAWRVEQSALILSAPTPENQRDSAARRAALALEGLDRADRAGVKDQAIRADLAIAAAEAMNEDMLGDQAVSVLDRVRGTAGGSNNLPTALQQRMLEERIAGLINATRSVDTDLVIKEAIATDPNATADAAARVLRRMAAADLGLQASQLLDEQQVARIARLAAAILRIAPPTADRDEVLAGALVTAGMYQPALDSARRAVAARGERADLLLALAESLWGVGGDTQLAEAFTVYDRLARSVPEESPAWWLCQVRRLQILDRVNRSTDSIAPKVARLSAMDAALGGPAFTALLRELAARHE